MFIHCSVIRNSREHVEVADAMKYLHERATMIVLNTEKRQNFIRTLCEMVNFL